MFDEIMNMVKEAAGKAVNNTSDVANDQTDAIAQHASGSLLEELKSAVSNGSIQSLFNGQSSDSADHPVTQNIVSKLAGSLSEKFGISQDTAASISSSIIPSVMSKLTGKVNDSNDSSFSLDSIKEALSNGNGGGLMDKLKGLFS